MLTTMGALRRATIALLALVTFADAQAVLEPGWPVVLGPADDSQVPVLVDIDADADLEIIVPSQHFGIRAFEYDGSIVPGWSSVGCPMIRLASGNLDGDEFPDFVTFCITLQAFVAYSGASGAVLPGWPIPFQNKSDYWAIGDVNGDGLDELVFASRASTAEVHCVDRFGQSLPGWPATLSIPPQLNYDIAATDGFAVGDLDFDGQDEVVVTYLLLNSFGIPIQSPIWLLDGTGSLLPGWPLTLFPGSSVDSPIVADLDGDFSPELVLPGRERLHVVDIQGLPRVPSVVSNNPFQFNACADLDGDGLLEIILTGLQLRVFGLDLAGSDNLFLQAETPPTSTGYSYELFMAPVIGDVDGDGLQEIAVWSIQENGQPSLVLHLFDLTLNELDGWPMTFTPTNFPVWEHPAALGDLDGDGDAEIVSSYQQEVFVWDQVPIGANPAPVEWGMLGHDASGGAFYHRGAVPEPMYVRGDGNGDGRVDLPDAVFALRYLFQAATTPCEARLDADSSGVVDPADVMALLSYLFLGAPAPGSPFPDCDSVANDVLPCFAFECP